MLINIYKAPAPAQPQEGYQPPHAAAPQGIYTQPQSGTQPPPGGYAQPGAPPPPPGFVQGSAYPQGQGYTYGQPGYAPMGAYTHPLVATTLVTGPTVNTGFGAPKNPFGQTPVSCECSSCHKQIVTNTEYKIGMAVWMVVGVMCLMG